MDRQTFHPSDSLLHFFRQLLAGQIAEPQMIASLMARYTPALIADDYMVWILRAADSGYTGSYDAIYEILTENTSPEFRYQMVPTAQGVAVVFGLLHFERDTSKGENYIGNRRDFLKHQLWFAGELIDEASARCGICLRCYAGRPKAGFAGIAESYSEVLLLIGECEFLARPDQITTYQQFEHLRNSFPSRSALSYLLEVFSKQLATRKYAQAETSLLQLLDACFVNAAPLPEEFESVIYVITATVLSTYYTTAAEIDLQQIYALKELMAFSAVEKNFCFSGFKDKLLAVVRSLPAHPASSDQSKESNYWLQAVKSYIEENIADQNLTLTSIAEHFRLSPAHVSRTFTQQYGIHLTGYLQELRVSKAAKMLASEKPLSEIAALCGFTSVRTMRSIFAKYKKQTPSDYRRMLKQSGGGSGC